MVDINKRKIIMNSKWSEQTAIIGRITPQVLDGASLSTTGIRFEDVQCKGMCFIVYTGTMSDVVDAKLVQAATSDLTSSPSDITSYAVTQIATASAGKVVTIEIDEKDVPLLSTKPYVGVTVTAGSTGSTTIVTGIALGFNMKHRPGSEKNVTAIVLQQV
jgi:hypothetical protein